MKTFDFFSCRYIDGTIFPNTFYNISVPLDRCNSESFPNGTRRNTVIVQRDSRILEASDNKYILTCNPSGPGGGGPDGQFTVTLGGITVQGDLSSTEIVSNAAASLDYQVEVQLGTGPTSPPVNRVVRVGEPIAYVIKISETPNFDARVGRCWANDGSRQKKKRNFFSNFN